uniref:Uncharacterized protein n=1 Tax=Faecalibaculum rodentium TaxID=1702221 RepID=A0A140DWL0_9FIRM|nr:hypothetical protein AALO17_19030 [Faecalibaculum rodentium]
MSFPLHAGTFGYPDVTLGVFSVSKAENSQYRNKMVHGKQVLSSMSRAGPRPVPCSMMAYCSLDAGNPYSIGSLPPPGPICVQKT